MLMNSLVWFRTDLRATDNTALAAALRDPPAPGERARGVVGLFVISPAEWTAHDSAPVAEPAAMVHRLPRAHRR